MNRITITFLVLLALATVAAGQLWIQTRIVVSGPMTVWNATIVGFSALLLLVTLTGLGRMLYWSAKVAPVVSDGEKK